jgi:hypothetical protein
VTRDEPTPQAGERVRPTSARQEKVTRYEQAWQEAGEAWPACGVPYAATPGGQASTRRNGRTPVVCELPAGHEPGHVGSYTSELQGRVWYEWPPHRWEREAAERAQRDAA